MLLALAGTGGCSGHEPPATADLRGTGGGGPIVAGGGAPGGGQAAGGAPGAGNPTGGTMGQSPTGCMPPSAPAGTWVEIAAPSDQSGFFATDAFAVGQDDLLFAGSTFDPTLGPMNARVLRWTHGCWTLELSIPTSTTPPDSPSVHGTGPSDLWATASDLLYHRDAQGWTRFADETWRSTVRQPPSFLANNGAIEFNRLRAAAPGDFWIAATSNILHWSGAAWTTYNFDDPTYPNTSASVGYYFDDIWIDSPSSVWVVGLADQVGNTMSEGAVNHFDGATWTHTHNTAVGTINAIWRGGAVLWLAQPSEDGLSIRSFDGAMATAVPIAGVDPTQQSVNLTRLFGRGANDVWGSGDNVAHFDGQGWSLVSDAPDAARSTTGLETNTLVTGDAASTWLVTPGPRFFRKVTGP
ncbi:MAG TPA: hypothetical protein VMT03_02595 [Polyangia bacterium]|nr:hypothetical protein [Polyangia bacterium]